MRYSSTPPPTLFTFDKLPCEMRPCYRNPKAGIGFNCRKPCIEGTSILLVQIFDNFHQADGNT
jgi:hypothetical protein